MGLSRSAYYKYKDYVFPFYEASKEKIITLSLLLEHKPGRAFARAEYCCR